MNTNCYDSRCESCSFPPNDARAWKFLPAAAPRDERHDEEYQNARKLAIRARCSAAIGLAALERRRGDPGRATQVLRDVLVDARDEPEYLDAWVARARAFEDMLESGSPLGGRILVEMHLEKAASIDPADEVVALEVDAVRDDIDRRALGYCDRDNAPLATCAIEAARNAARRCREADSYMGEQFFASAARKYEGALACLDQSPLKENDALRRVRLACHLNLAACRLLANEDPSKALAHCEAALILERDNTIALLRRAVAYTRSGDYALARADLSRAAHLFDQRLDIEARNLANARLDHLTFVSESRATPE